MLTRAVPDFSNVSVEAIANAAVGQTRLHAERARVDVKIDGALELEVLVPRELVVQAMAWVLDNAIEAPRPADRTPRVSIESTATGVDVVIVIADNGTGIPDYHGQTFNLDTFNERPSSGGTSKRRTCHGGSKGTPRNQVLDFQWN